MKNVRSIIIIGLVLLVSSVTTAFAQRQAARTSSAMAAYGLNPATTKQKSKSKVKRKSPKKHLRAENRKRNKATRASTPAYRKKYNWAG